MDPDGEVYRKGKLLMQQVRSGRRYANIYRKDGSRWMFDSLRIAKLLFGLRHADLTAPLILSNIGAREIPEWPRYAVTNYGAVYCIDPPLRGPNAGRCFMLYERLKGKHPYVTLYNHDGTRRCCRVSDIVSMAWPD